MIFDVESWYYAMFGDFLLLLSNTGICAKNLVRLAMSYVSWFGSDRSGSDRFGSDQLGQTGSVRSGSAQTKSFQTGSVRPKSVQTGSIRTGSVRSDSLLYALLSVNLLIQEIYLAYQIIPSTVS